MPILAIDALLARRTVDRGCWLWTGPTNGAGYGVVSLKGTKSYVHRLSYELAEGPIPPRQDVDHLCRRTLCFRPDHLEAVTHAENMRRSPLMGAKRSCRHGHPFDQANTYITPAGARRCRRCAADRERRRRSVRRAH